MTTFAIIVGVWALLSFLIGVAIAKLRGKQRERDELLQDYLTRFAAQHPVRDPDQVRYPPFDDGYVLEHDDGSRSYIYGPPEDSCPHPRPTGGGTGGASD